MMRGRPKKVVVEPDADLEGHEAAQYSIAQVLQERCGIPGCGPKLHMEEAGIILKKLIRLDLVKDSDF